MKLSCITEAHEYSSTQYNVTGTLKSKLVKLAKSIDKDDLTDKGAELDPHITILYGLHINNDKQLKELLGNVKKFRVKLGKISKFDCKDNEVVKFDITNCSQLEKLNKLISKNIDHTNTHPTYHPHLTIAYVKRGTAEKYCTNSDLSGSEILIDKIYFSDKLRRKTPIHLK